MLPPPCTRLAWLATPTPLTLTVQNVVPGEHDSTAHDVPFITAGPEGVPHATAMEDLPIICPGEGRREDTHLKEGLTLYPTLRRGPCFKQNACPPPSLALGKGRGEGETKMERQK